MVKIIDFKSIEKEGKEFNMLVVQGGLEPLISKQTGRIYLTMRKANVSTTFDEATCKSLIGIELPGSVKKVECEAYEYIIQDSGEKVILNYSWQYIDEDLVNANNHLVNDTLIY